MLMEAHDKDEVLTGVFYVDTQKPDFTALLNMVDEPLATLPADVFVPAATFWRRSWRNTARRLQPSASFLDVHPCRYLSKEKAARLFWA